MGTTDEDPKKLLRCECGRPINFTLFYRCATCGKIMRCRLCPRKLRENFYCKKCHRDKQREMSREPKKQ